MGVLDGAPRGARVALAAWLVQGTSCGGHAISGDEDVSSAAGGAANGGSVASAGTSASASTGPSDGALPTESLEACFGVSEARLDAEERGAAGAAGAEHSRFSIPAVSAPVDMYLLLEGSHSMVDPHWDAPILPWQLATSGVERFVSDTDADRLRLAFQLFSWEEGDVCSPEPYSMPTVPMGEPERVVRQVMDTIAAAQPAGHGPLHPALKGAADFATSWSNDHPERRTVVVLIVDGPASACDPGPVSALAEVAGLVAEQPPHVDVYFVGIYGSHGLESAAVSGNTRAPRVLEPGSYYQDVVDVLTTIAEEEARCQLTVPPSLSSGETKLVLETSAGGLREIPWLSTGRQGCATSSNGGWYFVTGASGREPVRVATCPCTCAALVEKPNLVLSWLGSTAD